MFDFYLKHHDDGKVFNSKYLDMNGQLNKKFNNMGRNLCQNARKHLKDKGCLNYLVELSAEECPEILRYWKYNSQFISKRK